MANTQSHSIYPDFLKAGISKLQTEGVLSRDLLTLFSALENFQRELKTQERVEDILASTQRYVDGLELFDTAGFFLVNPDDFDFKLAWCHPGENRPLLGEAVQEQIRNGQFAWALRKNAAVFFTCPTAEGVRRGVFHPLAVFTHVVGMFCGLLRSDRVANLEIALSLMSVLLGACAQALVAARNTENLKQKILAANRDLQRTLQENEILARFPAESPSPVIRISRTGKILYGNTLGQALLAQINYQEGDLVGDSWLQMVTEAFATGGKKDYELKFGELYYTFLVVAIQEAGYANFYGTDITARKRAEADRERLIGELQEALANVKTLSGMLPICAWCKKIRDDTGYWKQIENYIESRSKAVFSHGVCPDCMKKLSESIGKMH